MQNNSPWLQELDNNFALPTLNTDIKTDLTIIGGGLSGLISAFYILKHTKLSPTLIDSYKIGHGSSGHNLGYLQANLEINYQDLIKIFGAQTTTYSIRSINTGWKLLKKILAETKIKQSCQKYNDFDAYTNPKEVISQLEDQLQKKNHKLPYTQIYISESCYLSKTLEKKYLPIYKLISTQNLNKKVKTKGYKFIALKKNTFVTLNTALFCQNLANFLLKNYPLRFQIYENTQAIGFKHVSNQVSISTTKNTIHSTNVLFCTNAHPLKPTNKLFQRKTQQIFGKITSATNLRPQSKKYYLDQKNTYSINRFSLLSKNLFLVSGATYQLNQSFLKNYTKFSSQIYNKKYDYSWSNYYAQTHHQIPLSGQNKKHSYYWYNLGHNPVSLLTHFYCAYRISLQMSGKKLPSSIFDP